MLRRSPGTLLAVPESTSEAVRADTGRSHFRDRRTLEVFQASVIRIPYPAMRWSCIWIARFSEPEVSPKNPDTSSRARNVSSSMLAHGKRILQSGRPHPGPLPQGRGGMLSRRSGFGGAPFSMGYARNPVWDWVLSPSGREELVPRKGFEPPHP